jgi:phosphotriesterase-related protein
LISFGGHGYSHIFDRIIPRLLHLGLTQEDVDTITIANPSRWLAFRHPRV